MFDGDIDKGELEIGQVSGMINEVKSAGEIINEIMSECIEETGKVKNFGL